MFIALKPQRTSEGERSKGAELPEALAWDLASVRNLVDLRAIEWRGEGGKYGPHTAAVKLLAESEALNKAAPPSDEEAMPVSQHSFDEYRKQMGAKFASLLEMVGKLEVAVGALSKSKGSAPAPKSDPIPGNKDGR